MRFAYWHPTLRLMLTRYTYTRQSRGTLRKRRYRSLRAPHFYVSRFYFSLAAQSATIRL